MNRFTTRISRFFEDLAKRAFFKGLERTIELVDEADKHATELNVRNTQEFINWQDAINKISVR